METLSLSEFRNNMASSFDMVDSGERIYIRRRNKTYVVLSVEDDEAAIDSVMQAKIDKARQEYKENKTMRFENAVDAQTWMDEL